MVLDAEKCDRERMRFGMLLLLGACQFTPGNSSVQGDGGTGGDGGGNGDSTPIDAALPVNGHVRPLDIDDTKVAGGPHTDYPLLVSLSATWLRDSANGGDVERADGFDLYFAADPSGTERLAHEIEVYAPATGDLIAWVKVPSLSASTTIYLHYGDPANTTDPQSVAAVWSTGYQLVTHLDAVADATGKTPVFSASSLGAVAGEIDRARDFNGSSDSIDADSATAIDNVFAAGGTAEGWFFANSYGENGFGRLFDKGHTAGWSLSTVNSSNGRTATLGFVYGASTSFGEWNGPSNAVSLDTWHHAAAVFTASVANDPVLYVDGVALTGLDKLVTPSGTISSDATADLIMGNRPGNDRTFDGVLDELRLSSVPRSADWLLTQYRNHAEPTLFVTAGAPL